MRYFLVPLVLATLIASCSDYQKALKSTDINEKFRIAEQYYLQGEKGSLPGATRKEISRAASAYERAIPLLEELVQLTRGTAMSEKVYYYHARCQFAQQDYILASYYLNNFTKTFPASEHAEECAFLSAYCYYRNSPNYELDQSDTKAAINDMQLFIAHYPHTTLRDSANGLIDQMRGKLEIKDLNNARQYYQLRNYQGTLTTFGYFLQTWPNSEFREEALFTLLKAGQQLALNSVESRKKQRLTDAIRAYHNFADAFPESIDKGEADRILEELTADLARLYPPPPPNP